ncbi:hypothetical protein KC19_VG233500 [Ceratodon purpureus]|uniref:Uncharacterized protein n=1 Tax=Ceratodon purpureus TaxID=3225 RepID=A0A8T0HT23_CERPU|nr:hypothetical protein KC19_VG233500 [Ceratodon purpureus]
MLFATASRVIVTFDIHCARLLSSGVNLASMYWTPSSLAEPLDDEDAIMVVSIIEELQHFEAAMKAMENKSFD